jgi:Flp pilus assembly protein protease CpaA
MTKLHIEQPLFAHVYTWLASIGIAVLAIGLISFQTSIIPFSIVFAGMLVLFVGISLNDLKTRRVPNWVTYPLMLIGVVRAIALTDGTFLLYWAVLFSLWQVRFMGGGDAKLLMGFFGLFPNFQLVWLISICVLLTGIPYLGFKYRKQLRNIPKALFFRLITRQFLPSQTEFEREAVPYAFSFCLGCMAYIWFHIAPR